MRKAGLVGVGIVLGWPASKTWSDLHQQPRDVPAQPACGILRSAPPGSPSTAKAIERQAGRWSCPGTLAGQCNSIRTILLPQDVRADLDDKQADRISNEGEIVKALRLPGTTD